MHIPLLQFEQYIPEPILKKGLDYFRKDRVTEVRDKAPGLYQSIVQGSTEYSVTLEVQNGMITRATCNCPYADGTICKHITALIFYLQQDSLGLTKIKQRSVRTAGHSDEEKKSSTAPPKTAAQKRKEATLTLCEQLSKTQLVEWIAAQAGADIRFATAIQHAFAADDKDATVKKYAAEMNALLKSAIGSSQRNIWRRAPQAGRAAQGFLSSATSLADKGQLKAAAMMAFGALEALTKALQYIDDSNAHIGENIREAIALLYRISASEPDDQARNFITTYCLSAYKKKIYGDWDWHLDMVHLASRLTYNKTSADTLIHLIESEPMSRYSVDTLCNLVHHIYLSSAQFEKADAYLAANLHAQSLRKFAIHEALGVGNTEEAIRLAKEGHEQDKMDKPGLAKEWLRIMMNIFADTGDAAASLQLARDLFLNDPDFNPEYYAMMQKMTPISEWPDTVAGLLRDAAGGTSFFGDRKQLMMLAQESMWKELLDLLAQKPAMWKMEQFDPILAARFPDAWNAYIVACLSEEARLANTRNRYVAIYHYLVRLIKSGRDELAMQLLQQFRAQYPHRPSMMEVLNRLG